MAFVVLGIVVIAVIVVSARLVRRFGPAVASGEETSSAAVGIRTGLLGAASLLGAAVAALAMQDETLVFRPLTVGTLAIAAVTCAVVAMLGLRSRWSQRSHATWVGVVLVAFLWLTTSVLTWPFVLAATSCGCGGGVSHPAPVVLGLDPRGWIVIVYVLGPLLVLIAATRLPDDLAPRRLTAR